MSYELHFVSKRTSPTPSAAEIWDAFAQRNGSAYRLQGSIVQYANEDTGVSFAFHLASSSSSSSPSLLSSAPDANQPAVTLSVTYLRPHIFGLEAEREARALALRFDFDVIDPQPEGMTDGVYSSDGFLRGYAIANAAAHAALDLGDALALPSGTLTHAWRWNVQRAALQRSMGEGTFIPKVICVAHPKMNAAAGDAVATAIVWSRFMPALLPFVDVYMLVADELPRPIWVMRADIAFVLEALPVLSARFRHAGLVEQAGIAHYDARQGARLAAQIIAVASAQNQGARGEPTSDLPRVIPTEKVLSREIARRGSARMSVVPQFSRVPAASMSPMPPPPMSGELWSMPAPLTTLATANDVVLATTQDRVALWDRATGRILRAGRRQSSDRMGTLAISADAKALVVADAVGNVSVFDLDVTGPAFLALSRVESIRKDLLPARIVGMTKNGSTIALASASEVTLLRDDNPVPRRIDNMIGTAALAHDERRILIGPSIFDMATGERLKDVHDKLENAVVAAFSPDDSHIAYVTTKGEIALASIARELITLKGWIPQPAEGTISPTSISYVANGARLAIATKDLVYIVDVETLTVVRIIQIGASAAVAVHEAFLYRINGNRITTEPWTGTGTSLRPQIEGREDAVASRAALLITIADNVKTGKLDEAERIAKELILAADRDGATEQSTQANVQLGLIALARETPAAAIEPFRIAADGFARDLGPASANAVMARVNQGLVLLQCERANDAATIFRSVIHATRNAPEVREHVIPALHNLGLALVRVGSPLLALTHLDEALNERERTTGKDHPLYVDTELVKANALIDLGRLVDSQALIHHAASIALKGGGEAHHLFGEAVFAEARRVAKLGDGLRADALARRALRLAEKDAGVESFTYRDRSTRAARLRSTWRDSTRLADPGGARQLCEITVRHTLRRWRPEKLAFDDSGSLPKIWYIDAPAPWTEPGAKQLRDAVKLLFATSNDELNARQPDDPNYLDVIDVDVKPMTIDYLAHVDWERAWRDRVWEPSGAYVATAFGLRPITFSELGVIAVSRLLVAQCLTMDEAEAQLMKRFGLDAAAAADVSNAPNDADAGVVRPS